jgi:S-DNA-T family DNA segregation ATPase FtsK/SpoIIIE
MTVPLFAPRRVPQAETAGGPSGDGAARAGTDARRREHPPEGLARPSHSYAREAAALVLLTSALYATLALGSFVGDPLRPEVTGPDWVGPVGAFAARAAAGVVGAAAWLVPFELTLLAMPLLNGQPTRASVARFGGDVVVLVVLASILHIAFPVAITFGAMPIGGSVGELFGEVLRSLFSEVGSYIIGLTVVLLILIGRATFSFIESVHRIQQVFARFGERSAGGVRALLGAWQAAREIDQKRQDEEKRAAEPLITTPSSADAIIAALTEDAEAASSDRRPEPAEIAIASTGPRALLDPSWADDMAATNALLDAPTPTPPPRRGKRAAAVADAAASFTSETPGVERDAGVLETVLTPSPIMPLALLAPVDANTGEEIVAIAPGPAGERERKPSRGKPRGPRIVDTSAALETEKAEVVHVVPSAGYRLPMTDMLEAPPGTRMLVDEEQLKTNAQLLEKTLSDYGVSGKVEEIHPGPTVTTFEVSPAAGTKVSKVASLADDLALGLSRKVRIIAPIPFKNRIGFEIPNEHRMPVNLRELIEDRRFLEMKAPLPCVLGRDIIGAPYFADLSSMPHVIVAGATGAGKSVALNVMLVSLLFRKTPEDLRLLMIDPKVVELAPFDRIPHMLLPVVTDMKQAANALKWAVDEMERRYQLFANAGTKNITTYNAWVERVQRGEAKPPRGAPKVTAVSPDGTEVEVPAAKDGSDAALPEKIPFIVIVVDEFADLMMQQGKDVEVSVARLAQKARAAGMHVILATQRPSVDVITGMIKANFPTRIAFRVAQKVDSRTILDEQGAEHLLGRGDMLIKMNGSTETRRVQCPFCSEEEVQRITDFLRLQGEPVYDDAILKPRDDDEAAPDAADAEGDPMYDAAVRIVAETRRCSTSWIQRKLGVGYNRAAKIVETMERRGIVGPANGAKDREVLISPA